MEMQLSIRGKHEMARIIGILQLGLLTALEQGIVSIEEAEGYIFSPYTAECLEQLEMDTRIVDVIRKGCELEDIVSLLPQHLPKTIVDLKDEVVRICKDIPRPELPTEKLIKK